MAQQAHEGESHGLRPRQYVTIFLVLTVITIVELAVSYSDLGSLMVPTLFVLSAAKFTAVVAFFMHLRFDHPILTRLFVGPLALAAAVLVALFALGEADLSFLNLGR